MMIDDSTTSMEVGPINSGSIGGNGDLRRRPASPERPQPPHERKKPEPVREGRLVETEPVRPSKPEQDPIQASIKVFIAFVKNVCSALMGGPWGSKEEQLGESRAPTDDRKREREQGGTYDKRGRKQLPEKPGEQIDEEV